VWLSHRQTTEAVIEGCEAAWAFFGGVFRKRDNLAAGQSATTANTP